MPVLPFDNFGAGDECLANGFSLRCRIFCIKGQSILHVFANIKKGGVHLREAAFIRETRRL